MKHLFLFLFLGNIIFLSGATYVLSNHYKTNYKITETRSQGTYTYINPLLECDIEYEYYNPGSIKANISHYIQKELEKDDISTISYYFRSLKNGEHFGYNLDEEFIPASLLKIPLAMTVLKDVALDDIYSVGMELHKDQVSQFNRNYGKDFVQGEGTIFSLHELLREMLQNSDNAAANLLFSSQESDKIHAVYTDLGIPEFRLDGPSVSKISVKKYSSFFRVLYNASYLSEDSSEYILGLLGRGGFNEGIRYYLPKNIIVANKFGERAFEGKDEKQIHDCGIVYIESPYLLCVMTRGTNFQIQLPVIQNISKMIYEYKAK